MNHPTSPCAKKAVLKHRNPNAIATSAYRTIFAKRLWSVARSPPLSVF
jgi:hypothetical protein